MINGRIYLLGSLRLVPGQVEEGPALEIGSARLQTLLAYLILHRQERLHRDRMAGCLWRERGPASARRNLREYLYRARQLLAEFWPGEETIKTEDHWILFTPPPECWIDLVEFERLSQPAYQSAPVAPPGQVIPLLQAAIDLYQGDLLANLYDDWVLEERERLRARLIDNMATLSQALQAVRRLDEAIAVTGRLLEYDPLREEDHRRLMELYYAGGDRARALQQYRFCQEILAEELAADPMPETQALYKALLQAGDRSEPVEAVRTFPPAEGKTSLFVGRQAELVRLTLALAESRTGRSKIMVVTGDSGLGKTRLVTEWLASLPLETIVLAGRGHEFEQDIPYRPVLDALQQSLHRVPWDRLPPDSTYTWLAPLAQLLPDLYYYLPDLPPAAGQADSETSHYVLEGLAQLLLSFACQAPVVLFVDDLHWADLPTWQFLRFLVRRARSAPVFVVTTFCTSEASREYRLRLRTLEEDDARLLALSRLWPADTARLVGQMLNESGESLMPLVHRLHREAQGNPFILIETLKFFLESDLPPSDWPEERLPLPSAVQTLIENRLDRLNPGSRQALATAAVIGRAFGFSLLAAVTGEDEEALLDHLEGWLARGLVVEQATGRYDFSHGRFREVAAGRLSRPRRRRIHYRVARALEQVRPVDVERVAYHDSMGDQPARALPSLIEAGRRALNLRSYREARKIGRTLLNILLQAPERGALCDRLELNQQLALAYCFTGEMDQALPVLAEAARLARTLADTGQAGEIALRAAQVYWLRGDAPEARRYAEEALELAQPNPPPAYHAAILRLLGRVSVAQGDFEAAVYRLRESLSLEDRTENPLNRAAVSGYLAVALAHLGQGEEALAALDEAQAIAHRVDSLTALAVARVQGAVAWAALERWPEAEKLAALGLADCEAQELPVYAFVARSVLGRAAHYRGDDAAAYRLLQEAVAWAEANDYILFRHMPHLYLAEIALAAGDIPTVLAEAGLALDLARRTGNAWTRQRAGEYLDSLNPELPYAGR